MVGLGRASRWGFLASIVVVGTVAVGISPFKLPLSGNTVPVTVHRVALGYLPASQQPALAEITDALTLPVECTQTNQTLNVTGHLTAGDRSDVASNVSGMVAELLVDRGSVVRKGDVLVRIDPTDAQNLLDEGEAMTAELEVKLLLDSPDTPLNAEKLPEVRLARAALDLAKANFERTAVLYEKKVETSEAFDRARTERQLAIFRYDQAFHQARQLYQSYRTARTRLAALRKAVADTTIVAPFDGWVVELDISVGERVSAGGGGKNHLLTLVRLDPLRLTVTVPQQHIRYIRTGQPVEFAVDAYPQRTFTGQVRYVTPVVAEESRSLTVEAIVPNREGLLKPGLFATAQLELEQQTTTLCVPASAIQKQGDAGRVFVVRDGLAREQIVALGPTNGDRVQITSGLASGDRIVAAPEKVRDGVKIRP